MIVSGAATVNGRALAASTTVTVSSSVAYGASVGGYWSTITPGEAKSDAYARITAGFGRLQSVRLFASSVPSYVDPAAIVCLDAAPTQATIEALAARQTISYLSTHHEPENDGGTPAAWHAEQIAAAAACVQYGKGRVRYVACLMGGTFMPGRPATSAYTLAQWLDFDMTNVWAIGSDSYQWGKMDATADSAATVLQPVLDAATARGKRVAFLELGARCLLSDAARAKFLKDARALIDASGIVDVACYFESDNGSLGPWCLLPPAGQPPIAPLAVAAWQAACTS